MNADQPDYLQPYLRAVQKHGAEFESLLWASPQTQAERFDAIARVVNPSRLRLLDVGCGRADLLDYLLSHGMAPAQYIGLEALEPLAAAAEVRRLPHSLILRGDFVQNPLRMFVDAQVVILCGSLNTLSQPLFYSTIRRAYDAATQMLVFNFLSSPRLAGKDYLGWHAPRDVLRAIRQFCTDVRVLDDYMDGDCTIALRKPTRRPAP